MKPVGLVILVLLIWGGVKLPWERRIGDERSDIVYGSEIPMSFELRETLGQELSFAALGGFRALAANYLWIKVTQAWEDQVWTRVRARADMAVTLQPRTLFFWENGAWHMAWNASVSVVKYAEEDKSEERKQFESRKWIDAGIDMLERGIRANPEKYGLYLRMAELYWQRLEDYEMSAKYYRMALERPGAPTYTDRFIGYALEKAGKYEESLAHWESLAAAPNFEERMQSHQQKVGENIEKLKQIIANGGPLEVDDSQKPTNAPAS
ncbi:MAG: hypothetical protein AAF571_05825 [Verrucomicrobiota bacterium]